MASKISIEDIVIKDLRPQLKNKELNKYLPTVLFPQKLSFTINGINNAISNAIRRTAGGDLLVSAMFAENENIKSNDEFIIPEMIVQRLRSIPILQSTPLDIQFILDVKNTTSIVRDVKTSEIKILYSGKGGKNSSNKSTPFNETTTLCTLKPGCSLTISPITIHQAYGFVAGDGMQTVGINTVSLPLDQKPINLYEPNDGGIPSRISDPRKWQISITTNGTMDVRDVIVASCNNIIARINAVKDLLPHIHNDGDLHVLVVEGESDTIGNLFMKTISELYPDIIAVVYAVSSDSRTLRIRVRCNEDVEDIFLTTIKYLTDVFLTISHLISSN